LLGRRVPRANRNNPFRLGLFSYVAHEAKAFASKGFDQALLRAAVADRPPGRIDPRGQRRFRNNAAAPDCSDQIVLAGNALTIFDQVGQEVEHLGLNRDSNGAMTQLAPIGVESVVFK
jgi:hypothetical protein